MLPITKKAGLIAALLMISSIQPGTALAFDNPINIAASPSKLGANSALLASAMAGSRIVAVGSRGIIIYSDDVGATVHRRPYGAGQRQGQIAQRTADADVGQAVVVAIAPVVGIPMFFYVKSNFGHNILRKRLLELEDQLRGWLPQSQ